MTAFIYDLTGVTVTANIWLALIFSFIVLILYAYQNFNKPLYSIEPTLTENAEQLDQETLPLQKIKPIHFMKRRDMGIKFFLYLVFLCVECLVLIFVVHYMPALAETSSSGSTQGDLAYQIVIATFVVSGLLPNVPPLNKIEEHFKRALHAWSHVPITARTIYANVAASNITPKKLKKSISNSDLMIFDANFLNVNPHHVNYRFVKMWLKYNILYQQLKIDENRLIKHDVDYGEFSWAKLQTQHMELHAQAIRLIQTSSGANIVIEQQFFNRTKLALKRLYAIVACSPSIQKMGRSEQEDKLTNLGFEMGMVEPVHEDIMSRALLHGFVMGGAVLLCSLVMFCSAIYTSNASLTAIDPMTIQSGLATALIWGAFSFCMFSSTAWITYTMHHWLVQQEHWITPSYNNKIVKRQYNLYVTVAFTSWLIVTALLTVVIALMQGTGITMALIKMASSISLSPFVLSFLMCFRLDYWKEREEPLFTWHRIPTALLQGGIMALLSSVIFYLINITSGHTGLILFATSGFVIGFFNSLLMQPKGVDLRCAPRHKCTDTTRVDIKDEMGVFIGQADLKDISEDGLCLTLTDKYLSKALNFCTQQEVVISYQGAQGNANYNATVVNSNRSDGKMHFQSIKDSRWLTFFKLHQGKQPATA